MLAAAENALRHANRYPTINATDVIGALAAHTGSPASAIAVADGALAVLQHVLSAYVHPGQSVVYAWRSYEAYPICVQLAGGIPRQVPLTDRFEHDLDAMLAAITTDTAAVILCNPNNPTGAAFGHAELRRFLDLTPSNVVVIYDEAYRDFIDPRRIDPFDATGLLARYPNLVVLRTLSKAFALAGLRVGYLVASTDIAYSVRRVIAPFPLSGVAAAAAIAALSEEESRLHTVLEVAAERQLVEHALAAHGYAAIPSHANFLWLPLGDDAEPFARHLREAGIAIRAFAGDGARITVGEPGLAPALSEALSSRENRRGREDRDPL